MAEHQRSTGRDRASPERSVDGASATTLAPRRRLDRLQHAAGNRATATLAGSLLVGHPHAMAERSAHGLAASIGSSCHCGGTCSSCSSGGAARVQRDPSGAARHATPRTGHDVAPAVADLGRPLPAGLRADLQHQLGVDLSPVRLHTGALAADATRRLGTDAFAVGTDVAIAPGGSGPDSPSGRTLIAHEVAHVVQQDGHDGPPLVQRNGGDPDIGASPCSVVEAELTNAGLLAQLNRCRVYLVTHERGEGRFYDEANLFRRLDKERTKRERAGHLWLIEPGLYTVPPVLYRLSETGLFGMRVDEVSSDAAASPTAHGLILTPDQFQRFLAAHDIPQMDPLEALLRAAGSDGRGGFDITIPFRENVTQVFIRAGDAAPAFDPTGGLGGFRRHPHPFELSPFRSAPMTGAGRAVDAWDASAPNPFVHGRAGAGAGTCPGGCHTANAPANSLLDFRAVDVPGYDTTAMYLRDLVEDPRRFTKGGEERAYLPAPTTGTGGGSGTAPAFQAATDWGPFAGDERNGQPAILSGAAFAPFAKPPMPFPNQTHGILFEGSHVSDWAMLNGRLQIGGFRAPLATHGMVDLERMLVKGGAGTTAELNRGTTRGTAYYDDWVFPYMGDAVAIVRADGTAVSAQELIAMMDEVGPGMKGKSYSYSAPPEGHPAHVRGMAGQPPDFCFPGGMNCINRPIALHEKALGGPNLVVERNGQVISLADPAHASVANMRDYVAQSDEWFAARGLRKVPVTSSMRARAALPPLIGGGMGVLQNLYIGSQGGETHYVRDVSLGTGGAIAGSQAERYLAPRITQRLVQGGMTEAGALTGGRMVASSGAALVLAPAIEGLSMAFSDEDHTSIDYASRLTRTTVSAGGGLLAAGAAGALIGSAGTPVGTAVGFLAGITGYLVTDMLFGDTVEEAVREGMGEYGCTDGVGPGR